jgi:hypothetical protein
MTFLIESERRQSQLDFQASAIEIEVGDRRDCPLPLSELLALHPGHPAVREVHEGGLTAVVYKVHALGRNWAVKRARTPCLVQNVDGQTSFLNEVQRRAEITALRAKPGGAGRFPGIVDTVYASLRHGVAVSPWISGTTVSTWDARRFQQVFESGRELLRAGFFEWDFSPGNLLDDGRQVWLFDFGYMYRFDPLRHFNSGGDGTTAPLCHLAERIESRHVFGTWLDQDPAEVLVSFRLAKCVALATYRQLHAELQADGATAQVLGWLAGIADGWERALAGDLHALYLREGWRSHVMDLEDDLHGRTCTPKTLQRVDWLLDAVRTHHGALLAQGALFDGDEARSRDGLITRYTAKRREAEGLQVRLAA